MNHLHPNTYAKTLSWFFGVVMTLLLAGCNSGDKEPILQPGNLSGLSQIVVNPVDPTLPAGLTRQFEALGVYADGTSVNISDRVSWTSANTTVATINATGMVTASRNGSSAISATFSGKTGVSTLTVSDAALVSITLSPLANTALTGVNLQFTATGQYSNGSSQNLTGIVIWTSSAPEVVSFNPNRMADSGLASALTAGSTTVMATMDNINASTTLTVTAASVTGLTITPANPSVIAGLTQQMQVTGTFNNGTSLDLTSQAVWSSADLNLLTFNSNGAANSGLATTLVGGNVGGNVVVSASFSGMTATTNVQINSATLTALTISPATASVAAGNSQPFIATGSYNNGTAVNVTALASFASSDTNVAYLSANQTAGSGVATSLVPGTAQISVTITTPAGAFSSMATLTVTNAVISAVTVTPATPVLINGFTQQLQATAIYTDQTTVDVTTTAIWTSADLAVVTLYPSGQPSSGLATPLLAGTALIQASIDAEHIGSTLLTVVDATVTNITLTPLASSLPAGNSQQFTASGTFSNGSTLNLTPYVNWLSSNPTVASFNPNLQADSGLFTALTLGSTDVSASLQGVQSMTAVTVAAATLVNVTLAPASPTLSSGQTLPMQLLGSYSDNSVANLASIATWTSSDPLIATFNPNLQPDSGQISGLAIGTTTVSAELITVDQQTLSASTALTVTAALVANPQAPDFGSAADFVLAASQSISTTPGSSIANGHIAILQANRALMTGFTASATPGEWTELSNGLSYAPDDTNPPYPVPVPYASTTAYLNQVNSDVQTAATFLADATNPISAVTVLANTDLGGLTLTRGVYHLSGDVMISQGNLSLDAQNDPASVFIIYVDGNFSTAAPGGQITLLNGASAQQIYWRVSGSTSLAASSAFAGNLVGWLDVQLGNAATVQGRLFSVTGDLMLNANSVSTIL